MLEGKYVFSSKKFCLIFNANWTKRTFINIVSSELKEAQDIVGMEKFRKHKSQLTTDCTKSVNWPVPTPSSFNVDSVLSTLKVSLHHVFLGEDP